jgi:hypothetical protein
MLTMDLQTIVVASGNQVSSALANEVVILDHQAGRYFGLKATGARIWKLLESPRSVEDIRNALVKEYDVEPNRCERDLFALLQLLVSKGLVDVRPSP